MSASLGRIAAPLICTVLASCAPQGAGAAKEEAGPPAAGRPAEHTLGYVLGSYDYDFYKTTDGKLECPHGVVLTNEEQWEAQFPTVAGRKAHLERCLLQSNRGPNCENVWNDPGAVQDRVPYRAVEGKVSFGANLDGTTDGHATTATCKHDKFTSPDGKTAVDNQYYRFLGCDKFIRSEVYSASAAKDRAAKYEINRILLELSGVDDLRNDNSVAVTLYRGMDPLEVDANGNALPWQSQRIDESIPPVRLKGRIVDGVLVTDPADVFFEGLFHERRQLIRRMSLRLKLDGVTAKGLRVGYVDVDRFWNSYSRAARWGGLTYGASPPSAYRALHALADGVKDPKTGQCTGLSSAREYDFVRAYLVRGGKARSL